MYTAIRYVLFIIGAAAHAAIHEHICDWSAERTRWARSEIELSGDSKEKAFNPVTDEKWLPPKCDFILNRV